MTGRRQENRRRLPVIQSQMLDRISVVEKRRKTYTIANVWYGFQFVRLAHAIHYYNQMTVTRILAKNVFIF